MNARLMGLLRPRPLRDAVLLIAATVLVYLLTANHGPLGSATRYYEAARETVELGQWTVPHLGYVPYLEKPPLVYWLGGAAQWLGSSPRIASLPSLLATIISVLSTWAIARSWRGPRFGLGAGFFFLGLTFPQVMSGVLLVDPLLAACIAAAWWTSSEWLRSQRQQRRWLWGFYLAIAVGWLAKGPIALALPISAIGVYTLLTGGPLSVLRMLLNIRPWLGLGIIAAVNIPWTWAVWNIDPRLVEFFYLRINFAAFTQGTYNHKEPWWFYFPGLCTSLAPYTLIALPVFGIALFRLRSAIHLRHDPEPRLDSIPLFLASTVIGPFILLSISSAKLGTYLLPLLPGMALLVASIIADWDRTPRWVTWVARIQAGACGVLALAGVSLAIKAGACVAAHQPLTLLGITIASADDAASVNLHLLPFFLAALLCLPVGATFAALLLARHRAPAAFVMLAGGVVVAIALVLPRIDQFMPNHDGRGMIAALKAHGGDDQSLPVEQRDIVILQQEMVHDYELLMSLGRRAVILGRAREIGLGHFIQANPRTAPLPGPGMAISNPYEVSGENTNHPWLWSWATFCEQWADPHHRIWLLCEDDYLPKLDKAGLPVYVIATARHNRLVSNRP